MSAELLKRARGAVSVREKQERGQTEAASLFQGMRETCKELLHRYGVSSEPAKDVITNLLNEFMFTGDRTNWGTLLSAPRRDLTRGINISGKSARVSLAARGEDLGTLGKSPIAIKIEGSNKILVPAELNVVGNFICQTIPPGGSDDWRITRIATSEDALRWHKVVEGLQQACTAS